MKLKELTKGLNIIFLCKFGSHLYGTSTPESDEDYKGVYIPTPEQCFLNGIPNSIYYSSGGDNAKNSKEDIDIEIYSIHYFLKLIQKGDTGSIDMLHAPVQNTDIVLECEKEWLYLYNHKKEFYTTDLSAFVGYCRTQANKYGIKGSRLNAAKYFLDILSYHDKKRKLSDIWFTLEDAFSNNEHVFFIDADEEKKIPFPMIEVCGRKLQKTVTTEYAMGVVEKFYSEYGKRAKLAAENKGVDWKAVSHAVRCAYEMKSIYEKGNIIFPLEQADYVLSVKKGEIMYNSVATHLEDLMDEVEGLVKESKFPEKPNVERWNQWLIKILSSQYRDSLI